MVAYTASVKALPNSSGSGSGVLGGPSGPPVAAAAVNVSDDRRRGRERRAGCERIAPT